MRKSWIVGLAVLAGTSYAAAQTDTSPPPTVTTQPASPPGAAVDTRPWIKAQALLKAVAADVRSNGIRAVEAHGADMEQAKNQGGRPVHSMAVSKCNDFSGQWGLQG